MVWAEEMRAKQAMQNIGSRIRAKMLIALGGWSGAVAEPDDGQKSWPLRTPRGGQVKNGFEVEAVATRG